MRINIIGGGLAGTALAYTLKKCGAEPVIYEASQSLAAAASGNEVGLYSPRFTAQKDAVAQFYTEGFFGVLEIFEEFKDAINWDPCGIITLMNTEKKQGRFPKTVKSWGWNAAELQLLDAHQASDIAGVDLPHGGLYTPRAGNISPHNLCHEYAKGVEQHLGTKITDLAALEGDATILACGLGVLGFAQAAHLPLKAVRGQVSYVKQSAASKPLKCALSYGGYIAPAKSGIHVLGATFQPWSDDTHIVSEDNAVNIQKLCDSVPALAGEYDCVKARAAVRAASKDHAPVIGKLGENLYISAAHGSHGIVNSLLAAKIIANKILGESAMPLPLDEKAQATFDPARFT